MIFDLLPTNSTILALEHNSYNLSTLLPAPRSPIPDSSPAPSDRQAILDDPKLNDILGSLPGATITEIK